MKKRLCLTVVAAIDVLLFVLSGSVSADNSVTPNTGATLESEIPHPPIPADPVVVNAPTDVPEIVVDSGTVRDFVRVATTIYWHSIGFCYIPPTLPTNSTASDVPESVVRFSTIKTSPDRLLYYKDIRATNNCNQYVFSRIVADANYLYWVDATGLVRLSKNANLGDMPAVLNTSFADRQPYQIAIDSQYIYLSREGYTSGCPSFCFFHPLSLTKSTKTRARLPVSIARCLS